MGKLFNKNISKKFKAELILIMGKVGSGKSSMMGLIVRECQKYNYPVYCSHHVLGAIKINAKDLGKYDLNDCVVIIDEAQLEYDNRDFKSFSKENKYFFSNFRHHNCKVYILSQSFEDLDVKIRRQAQRIYIMQPFLKGILLLQKVRVRFGISEDETSIITKYKFNILDLRFKLGFLGWKYFDSYSRPDLPPLPIETWGTPPPPFNLKKLLTDLIHDLRKKETIFEDIEQPLPLPQCSCNNCNYISNISDYDVAEPTWYCNKHNCNVEYYELCDDWEQIIYKETAI